MDEVRPERITVRVAFALPDRQSEVSLTLHAGASAGEAVERSGLRARYQEIAAIPLRLAIFGRPVPESAVLKEGDRVEILRSLPNDPKETRRKLAARGQTMGRGSQDVPETAPPDRSGLGV